MLLKDVSNKVLSIILLMQELERCLRDGEMERAREIAKQMQGWELVGLEEALRTMKITGSYVIFTSKQMITPLLCRCYSNSQPPLSLPSPQRGRII